MNRSAVPLVPPINRLMAKRMRPGQMRRRGVAWLCALLMVFGTLLPLVSQASSRLFGTVAWIELCTTYGVDYIAVDRNGNPVDPGDQLEPRCIVCTIGTLSLALPATAPSMPAFASSDDQVSPPTYAQPEATDHFHLETQPRAPPVLAG